MFGNNKRIKSSKIDTLINSGVEVAGDVTFSGGLHLEGTVTGNVTASDVNDGSMLVVSEGGRVDGDVHVSYAVINGTVNGNVIASVKLELSNKACISGDVEYDLLAMASGATINGKMIHNEGSAQKTTQKPIPLRKEKNQIPTLNETVTA